MIEDQTGELITRKLKFEKLAAASAAKICGGTSKSIKRSTATRLIYCAALDFT